MAREKNGEDVVICIIFKWALRGYAGLDSWWWWYTMMEKSNERMNEIEIHLYNGSLKHTTNNNNNACQSDHCTFSKRYQSVDFSFFGWFCRRCCRRPKKMSQTDFGRLDPRLGRAQWVRDTRVWQRDTNTICRIYKHTSSARASALGLFSFANRFLRKQQSVHSRRHHKTPTTKMESLWRRATQNC